MLSKRLDDAPELRPSPSPDRKEPPLSRFKRLAPYFLIGPISGPLVAGVVINLREERPVLAGLYAIALVQYVILLPAVVARLGLRLG
jgi:hypothetical protein